MVPYILCKCQVLNMIRTILKDINAFVDILTVH